MTDAQIGARKNKSVRNHLFVLNSIVSDVTSSNKKIPINLSIMDFKQMFDAEELPIVLNAFYESGVKDDMFSLLHEANKSVTFAVKTPLGLTENRSIRNKIMQGDVMSPLLSSNMVDHHIGKAAVATKNIYMYKNKVEIPPLMMQDDTLAVSTCGFKTMKMNNLINTQTNSMGLQFGKDKCIKMHIGRKHNIYICSDCHVDAWVDKLVVGEDGQEYLKDEYFGRVPMKNAYEKKYLGDIFSADTKNEKNIKDKTDRAIGIVNKISTSLIERPFGKHHFKAAQIMRESMLLGSLLNNSESWINVKKQDLEKLEKPDTMIQRNILGTSGNPSKAFMYLELGFLPVKFVIMEKRMNFLRYILKESMSSMIRQVYETLKTDSTKGDFFSLVQTDMVELDIDFTDEEIENTTKDQWKKYIHEKIRCLALETLNEENSKKTKTKHIHFDALEMSNYLVKNKNTLLSKTIFSVRSGTLDIKSWNEWKYENQLCVMCENCDENIEHFMSCSLYGQSDLENHWSEINGDDFEIQNSIAREIRRRQDIRKLKLEEVGLPQLLAPLLQDPVEL